MAETTATPSAVGSTRPPVDAGRVVVVVLFALSMLAALGRGWMVLTEAATGSVQAGLELASSVMTVAFCALVLWAYLRRGPAVGTDRSLAAWSAAPMATCLPFVLPTLPHDLGGTGRSLAAFALILSGTAFSVWAVRHLDTCLSVLPQARALVDTGPYRWVRHPLYLGEIVAVGGFAVRAGHWTAGLLVLALLALQLYRAGREERLLSDLVPGYAAYRRRTWRIVPGLV